MRSTGAKIDQQRAKQIGKMLFERYDLNRNKVLQPKQCFQLFSDYCYRILDIKNPPTLEQAPSMHTVLDYDQDKRVTQSDFQRLAVQYLCGNNGMGNRLGNSYVNSSRQYQTTTKVTTTVTNSQNYHPIVKSRLDVIRRLFKKFDTDNSGYLTEDEIPNILRQVYREMGQNTFQPTRQDVQSYMRMVDTDRDGRVTLDQFQSLVIRSLKNAGFEIYQ